MSGGGSGKEGRNVGSDETAVTTTKEKPSSLVPIEHLEDRVNALLDSIMQSTERRDRALQEVRQRIAEDSVLHQQLHRVTVLQKQVLPSYVERAAALARTMQGSAAFAAKASHEVRQLRLVLQRAQEVKKLVSSMQTMERHVTEVPEALAANDLERAVKLLRSYDEAQRVLTQSGASLNTNNNEDDENVKEENAMNKSAIEVTGEEKAAQKESVRRLSEASALVRRARSETRERLRQLVSDGAVHNDRAALQNAVRLLAEMGFDEEGAKLYCDWVCAKTEQTLHKAVETELQRMNDPTTAAMSHLTLVSQILDTVVATYESETAFLQAHFGDSGPLALLRALHSRSTAQCVPVLKDFLAKRADVLQELLSPKAGRQERPMSSPHVSPRAENEENQKRQNNTRNATLSDANKRSSPHSPSPAAAATTSSVTNLAAVARRIDRILEESMHLVSCCQLYLSFLQEREAQGSQQHTQPDITTSIVNARSESKSDVAADHVWLAQDNALVTSVQELLSLYVPLQERYLELAFKQAVLLQKAQARKRRQQQQLGDKANGGGNAKGGTKAPNAKGAFSSLYAAATTASPTLPVSSPAALMAGLSSLYAAAAQRVEGAVQRVEGAFSDESEAEDSAAERGVGDAANNEGRGGSSNKGQGSRADSRAPQSHSQHQGDVRSSDEDDNEDDNEGGEGKVDEGDDDVALLEQPMTLPDDVFFFLRIALHRAANMKSTQITSAVIMAITNVIQDRLLPYVRRHMSPGGGSSRKQHGTHNSNFLISAATTATAAASPSSPSATNALPMPVIVHNGQQQQQQQQQLLALAILSGMRTDGVTVRALRWCSAGQQCVDYTTKLTREIAQLATGQYKGHDLLRFNELGHDLDIVAKEFATTVEQTLGQHAMLCMRRILATHLTRLAALSYQIDEEVFYHYELNDPWVQACVGDCEALLCAVDAVVDAASFDVFLRAAATSVASAVREAYMKKSFSTFGALQVDKETRALRSCFLGLAHESSPRQAFAALSLMATLLLCDKPRDALEEIANTALTAQEKKAVLLTRVDFSRDEVLALQLE